MNKFLDEVIIDISSGDGGNGALAWRREKYEPMGGPAGGNGGRGGNVYLVATRDMRTLLDFHYKTQFEAPHGQKGGSKNKTGRAGEDLIIRVPVGTVVTDVNSSKTIADLTSEEQKVLVAQGGRGGRGNATMATPTHRAPHHCEPGEAGVKRTLRLVLKLIADIGLVGLPNAGKSSLLKRLTAAKPKIADYPFTTLSPNLGVVPAPYGGDGFVIADIPGLIEGAAQGLGLGHKFLKHIERNRLLVHLVDISQEDILASINIVNKELAAWGDLKSLPQIILLSKVDLMLEEEADEKIALVRKAFPNSTVFGISCMTGVGMEDLKKLLFSEMENRKAEPQEDFIPEEDEDALPKPDSSFVITRAQNAFYVDGERQARLVAVTHLKDPESVQYLYTVLRKMGVIDALIQAGVEPGDDVIIGSVPFTFGEDWS
ncbi:GTPase ObgE [bacterium]|nr:GTPase ObgE [bacterium]QQR56619.1 MAG: GTPase ObgE [Candidatus Melainabacteria bacterium]